MLNIEKAQAIRGWMTPRELTWLAEQAAQHQRIVEIGSYLGRSTRALADHTTGVVIAIDPWKYKLEHKARAHEEFCVNLADHLATGRVMWIRAYSSDCESPLAFALKEQAPDMLFIDGNHSVEGVTNDIQLALRLVPPGGLICGHDYGRPRLRAVTHVVNAFFPKVETEDSIWWVTR